MAYFKAVSRHSLGTSEENNGNTWQTVKHEFGETLSMSFKWLKVEWHHMIISKAINKYVTDESTYATMKFIILQFCVSVETPVCYISGRVSQFGKSDCQTTPRCTVPTATSAACSE